MIKSRARAVVLVEAEELGEVRSSQPRAFRDLEEILVVFIQRISTEIR